jgi:hypothetical protein
VNNNYDQSRRGLARSRSRCRLSRPGVWLALLLASLAPVPGGIRYAFTKPKESN